MGFPFLVGPVAFIAHYAIPIVNNLYIVFSSYFELFKDIIFFLVIDHFDENILVSWLHNLCMHSLFKFYLLFQQHRYDEVGGINLQFVSWYILAVACGSYVSKDSLFLALTKRVAVNNPCYASTVDNWLAHKIYIHPLLVIWWVAHKIFQLMMSRRIKFLSFRCWILCIAVGILSSRWPLQY